MPGLVSNGPHAHSGEAHPSLDSMNHSNRIPNRLILCFDGTGNEFLGNTGDTNIVKLYNKFDRSAPHQMHYYQPGIGTYTADGSSINTGWFGKIKRSVSKKIDEGIATTFDSHVIAGYRFLMRYYGRGDRIYIFGFSRGAFTARFLARMVSTVGLLSMGNEEMVPFAYKVYQDFVMDKYQSKLFIQKFKNTFCRDEHDSNGEHSANEIGIKVHFLGLFDTVSSVGTFDIPFTKEPKMPEAGGTAEHVRHAVAIDERRVKFKAALFDQELKHNAHPSEDVNARPCDNINAHVYEDIKEVWFAGNHGDIGGGWPAIPPKDAKAPKSFWKKLTSWIKATKSVELEEGEENDSFQHSDIALKWMIDELNTLGKDGHDQIQWDKNSIKTFNEGYKKKEDDAIRAQMHDTMRIGGGCSIGNVIFWNIMEYLPFIKRWEWQKGKWEYVAFPLNQGGTRDIPQGAKFHRTVLTRMRLPISKTEPKYAPQNAVALHENAISKLKNGNDPPLAEVKLGKTPPLELIKQDSKANKPDDNILYVQ